MDTNGPPFAPFSALVQTQLMDCCVQTDIEVARLDFFSVKGHGTISTPGCMTEVGRGNAIVPPSDLDIKHVAMARQGHVQGVYKVLAVRSQREGQEEKYK